MAPGLTPEDLRPYVSVQLCRIVDGREEAVQRVLALVVALLDVPVDPTHLGQVDQRPLEVGYATYQQHRTPSWAPASGLVDVTNHLAVVARHQDHLAIYASDPGLGRRLASKVDGDEIDWLTSVEPDALNGTFVSGPARTLWLSGNHRRSDVKPDSKVLAGSNLRAALDPLADQSYHFTAARSYVDTRTVGVNPRRSRLWSRGSTSWDDFLDQVEWTLARLDQPIVEQNPLPWLSSSVSDLTGLETPYDVSVIAPELLTDADFTDADEKQLAETWAYDGRFTVAEISSPRSFLVDVALDDDALGKVRFDLEQDHRGRLKLSVTPEGNSNERLDESVEALGRPRWTTIRFESGHTFADGVLHLVRPVDRSFLGWKWANLTGTSVKTEKPLDGKKFLPEKIGAPGETSLFSWVHREWSPQGWLACDDGSGEIADFIHITEGDQMRPHLRLIHVKGSGSATSTREISTSDYEVVIGQALKNLRFLYHRNLAEQLEVARKRPVGKATWHDGVQLTDERAGLLNYVATLGTNHSTEVVVVQPRVTEAELEGAHAQQALGKESSRVKRLRQLDTLLLEAESACRNLGATFTVVGDGTP